MGCCQALPQPEPLPRGAHRPPSLVRLLSRLLPPVGNFQDCAAAISPRPRLRRAWLRAHTLPRAEEPAAAESGGKQIGFFKAGDQRLPDASEPRRAPAPRSSAPRSPVGLDLGEGLQRFQEFSILSRSRKVSKTDGQILRCHPLPIAKTWFWFFVI